MKFRRFANQKLSNRFLAIPVDKTLASVPRQVLDEFGEPRDREGAVVDYDRRDDFGRELTEALLNVGWHVYDGVKVSIEEKVVQGEFPR